MMNNMVVDSIASKSLSEEYFRLKSCYQSKKRENQRSFPPTLNNDDLHSSVSNTNPESLDNLLSESFVDSIAKEFTNEIKVAGIRATRERLLLEKIENVKNIFKTTVSSSNCHIKDLGSQVNAMKETILKKDQDHNLKCDEMKEHIATNENELKKARKELKNMTEQLETVKKEHQSLITRHEVEVHSLLQRFEDEIINIKQKADENYLQLKNSNDEEKRKLQHDLAIARASLKEEENQILHLHNLEKVRSEADSNARNELLDHIRGLEMALDEIRLENHQLHDEMQNLRLAHDENLHAEKLLQCEMKELHDNELKEIENRIKVVIASHENILKDEKARTLKAEKRANQYERCIKRLENGL
jgi:chromosome segregation ATPase